jgi:hypothetical protein
MDLIVISNIKLLPANSEFKSNVTVLSVILVIFAGYQIHNVTVSHSDS